MILFHTDMNAEAVRLRRGKPDFPQPFCGLRRKGGDMTVTDRQKGMLFAAAGAVFWGTSGNAGQFILQVQQISPEWLTFFRLLLSGAVLLLAAFFRQGKDIFLPWKDRALRKALLAFGLFGMTGTQYFYFMAIRYSDAPTATVIQYTMLILIMLWVCLSERRFPGKKEIFCAAAAFLGVALVSSKGDPGSLAVSGEALFWGLASAAGAAFYTIVPAKLIRKYGAPAIVGWGMLTASAVMLPLSLTVPFTGTADGETLLAFLYVVFFGTVLAFLLYLSSTAYIGPAETGVLGALEPLASVVFAFLLFGTVFTAAELLGMACIIAAGSAVSRG